MILARINAARDLAFLMAAMAMSTDACPPLSLAFRLAAFAVAPISAVLACSAHHSPWTSTLVVASDRIVSCTTCLDQICCSQLPFVWFGISVVFLCFRHLVSCLCHIVALMVSGRVQREKARKIVIQYSRNYDMDLKHEQLRNQN